MNFNALNVVVATLTILLAVGFLCRKVGIINDISSKNLSKLILMVGQPAMLIYSMSSAEYTEENVKMAWIMLGLGFVFHGVLAVISYFMALPYKKNLDEEKISEFSFMFANCAFIGFPIFEALLGPIGLFMASFLTFSFNILVWTWGLGIFARKRKDIKLNIKKVLINFGTVPCLIGFIFYLLKAPSIGFEMPEFISKALSYLTNLCTPISVLITGALIATQSAKKIFCSWKLYYFNIMKLFVLPLLVCVISKILLILIPVDGLEIYAMFVTAAAALPAASTVSMMSETYGLDSGYSSVVVGTSSIISVLSMPLTLMLAQWILSL
ncbi:MAG: AEC family transporter [Eubacteriales bacterium]